MDKIGNDQEIARKAHVFYHAQLKFQAVFIVFHRSRMGNDFQSRLQPSPRVPAQGVNFIVGKFGQQRVAQLCLERTALRDFHCVFNCFRQVGKQCDHFRRAFEKMLRRQMAARFLLVHIGPVRDTDQRIMGREHILIGKINIVGGHQRQVHFIGHFDKSTLGGLFCQCGLAVLVRVALQFHVKAVFEHAFQVLHKAVGLVHLIVLQKRANRPFGTPGQADQPGAVLFQHIQRHLRHLIASVQKRSRT